jgi:hypothetical protein
MLLIIMDDFYGQKVLSQPGNPMKTLSIILNPEKFARPQPGVRIIRPKRGKNKVAMPSRPPYNNLQLKWANGKLFSQDAMGPGGGV